MTATAESHHHGTVGFNWIPQCLQNAPDRKGIVSLADRITACADKVCAVNAQLGEQMKAVIDKLVSQEVTVAFGGRFKSGKSLLLNRLLGRDILPVNTEAETGAPCFIQAASQDRAIAFRSGKGVDIPCTQESIASQLSLWRRRGGLSQAELAAKLDLYLSAAPVPGRTKWVDTPGLDDSMDMDTTTLGVFRHTDLLIWVLNSDAPLAIREQQYIASYTEDAGPHGIVFLTNVFIRDSSTYSESWRQFVDHQLPVQRDRLNQSASSMGFNGVPPRMLAVCGAAIGRTAPHEYGAKAVNDFALSLSSRDHLLVRASRLHRTSRVLKTVAAEMQAGSREHARANDAAESTRAEWDRVAGVDRASFERRVNAAADALAADLRNSATQAGRTVASTVYSWDIKRDDTYADSLRSEIYSAESRAATDFAAAVTEAARQTGQICSASDFRKDVYMRLSTPPFSISVPKEDVDYSAAVAAAAAGGVLAFFTGGVSALVGAGAAAGLKRKAEERALANDAAGARANIASAAGIASNYSSTWKAEAQALALDSFHPAGSRPPAPNRSPERYLQALAADLTKLASEADHLAKF